MAHFSYFKKVLIIFTILGMTLSMLPMRVQATDAPSANAPALTTLESDAPFVMRSGVWQPQITPNASGGSYLYSSGSGPIDSLTSYFEGSSVAIFYVQSPELGVMTVEIDGAVVDVVNTNGPPLFQQSLEIDDLVPGPHILRVYSVQGVIGIDAFRAVFESSNTPTARTTSSTTPVRQQPGTCNGSNTLANGDVAGLISAITTANATAGTDTICLAAGGTYTLTAIDNGSNGLPEITDNLYLVGQNATIERGSGAPIFRFFEVKTTAAFFTLEDVTLTGGEASAAGGAIRNDGGGVFINNSTLSNNTANTGGAIDNQSGSGSVTANGTTFINNSASYGGAIDNDDGNALYIYNSTFTTNQAANDGGAIHNDGGNLTVTGSQFTGNISGRYGGAIDSDDNSVAVIESSTFDGNDASDRGGAINNDGHMTIAENTVIINNTVLGWGGAIHTDDYLWVEDTTITFNEASNGGGIYNRGEDLQIVDSTISQNSAEDTGGGLFTRDGTTIISGSQFESNSAETDGGGIYANTNHTLTITNTLISSNTADEKGGGVYGRSIVGITDSALIDNTALQVGGAYYNNSTGVPTVNDTCIVGNSDTAVYSSSGNRDFTNNWWGDASGPSEDGPGTGDSVNDHVDYANFLTGSGSCLGAANPLDGATLVLTPASAGPNLTDTNQSLTATLLDALNNPLVGFDITFTITGANAQTDDITTDSNGIATFTYTGINEGTDTVQAATESGLVEVVSNNSTIMWDPLAGATLTIEPTNAGPNPLGAEQTLTATLLDVEGNPIEGYDVTFSVTGSNPSPNDTQVTDIDGQAELSYIGVSNGADTVTATVNSVLVTLIDEATVIWFTPVEPVSTSTIWGRFFTIPNNNGAFQVTPDQKPVFSQAFPTINFNPDPYDKYVLPGNEGDLVLVPGLPPEITTETKPFTNITTDEHGYFTGTIPAQGNGYQAGVGALTHFNAVFTGELTIATAGDYVFNFYTDDGFILGIDNGASYVSGHMHNPPPSGLTAFEGFTVVGASNATTGPVQREVVVNFPAPGVYPFELDYAQGPITELVLAWTIKYGPNANDVKGIPPTGALTLNFDSSTTSPKSVGQTAGFEVLVVDGAGDPMPNLEVFLNVNGVNTLQLTGTTGSNGIVSFNYIGQNVGTDQIQAMAWAQGSVLAFSSELEMVWQGGTAPPVLDVAGWIKSPLNRSVISDSVNITLSDDVNIVVDTNNPNVLDFWPINDPDQVTIIDDNVPAVTGGGILGTLDPTLLANGSYILRLHATSDTNEVKDSAVMITVESEYKPGRVRFSVTDLTIPVTGLPITISRTYDSLERFNSEDFGYGWTLDIANPRVDINAASDVTLTMPDGRRSTFYFTPTAPSPLFGFLLVPSYTPEPGVYGSLTSNSCSLLTISAGSYFCFPGAEYEATEFIYTDPYGREFVMSSDGTLQSITDLNNNMLTFDPNGITSSAGNLNVQFVRDAEGRITTITDPEGNIYTYGYNIDGELETVNLPSDGAPIVYSYTYDDEHRFLSGTDARNNTVATVTYYPDGHNEAGRLQFVTDAENNVTEYTYQLGYQTTYQKNPDGAEIQNKYDADRNLFSTEDGYVAFYYEYDDNRNVTLERVGTGATPSLPSLNIETEYVYNENGHVETITNDLGELVVDVDYNQYGGPTRLENALGDYIDIAYSPTFMPSGATDNNSNSLGGYQWNSHGNPTHQSNGEGDTRQFDYDVYGNLTWVQDEAGRVTTHTYDTLGRRTSTTNPYGTTYFDYDPLGRVIEVDAPGDGTQRRVTAYEYDGNGNMTAMVDPLGRRTEYAYDGNNNQTEIIYPEPSLGAGHPTEHREYDFRGNVTLYVDPEGVETQYEYDPGGRVKRIIRGNQAPADRVITEYTYDMAGRLITELVSPFGLNLKVEYVYDRANRLIEVRDQENHSTFYDYNTAGQLIEVEVQVSATESQITQYAYDVRGQVTTTTYVHPTNPALNEVVTYDYDLAGRMTTQTVDPSGLNLVTSYAYNQAGQMLTTTVAPGTSAESITTYVYESGGRLDQRIDPTGNPTTYDYYPSGQLHTQTNAAGHVTTYFYTQTGKIDYMVDANNFTTDYTYDPLDRLIQTDYPDGTSTTQTYDDASRLVDVTDMAGVVTHYTYDGAGRMLTTTHAYGEVGYEATTTYDYDAAGRMISQIDPRNTKTTYQYYPTGRLQTRIDDQGGGKINATTAYQYDWAGNMTSMTNARNHTTTYDYDFRNRLVQTDYPDLSSTSQVYDKAGRMH